MELSLHGKKALVTAASYGLGCACAKERGDDPEDVLNEWRNLAPSKKFGKPDDLGSFVSFLASPRGEFFNGTSIVMDGGALKRF